MSSIFGGSKSTSKNVNNGMLTNMLSPVVGAAQTGASAITNLLNGDMSGFNNFKQNSGFNAAAQQGSQGILANAASRGLLRSGGAGKALVGYGNQLGQQYLGEYMKNLLGLGQLGLGAGGVLAQSGQTSSSKQKNGLGGFLGGVLA